MDVREQNKNSELFKEFIFKHFCVLFIVGSYSYMLKGIEMVELTGVMVIMFLTACVGRVGPLVRSPAGAILFFATCVTTCPC